MLNISIYQPWGIKEKRTYCLDLSICRDSKSNEPDWTDPLSIECLNSVEEWVSNKETSSEEYGCHSWATLIPPSSSTELLGSPNDEAEDSGTGNESFACMRWLHMKRQFSSAKHILVLFRVWWLWDFQERKRMRGDDRRRQCDEPVE